MAMYGEPEYYDDEPQAAPPPAAPTEPDIADQLQEPAKLKDQGLLTEEEFQAKKKQILDL
jgi:Short C-terminal domain